MPFNLSLRSIAYIGTGLVIAALWFMAFYFKTDRDHWKDIAGARGTLLDKIVQAVETASGNDKVTWENAPGQIVALGESNKRLKLSIETQNQRIDEMAAEAVRLKARASELKKIADKAEAQRQSALKRLSDMSIAPGTRSDCMTLLREAEEALDLVRGAGV
jgi:hypothetical protein